MIKTIKSNCHENFDDRVSRLLQEGYLLKHVSVVYHDRYHQIYYVAVLEWK